MMNYKESVKEWFKSSYAFWSMLLAQIFLTGAQLLSRVVLVQGTFIFALTAYRLIVAGICIAPFALYFERTAEEVHLDSLDEAILQWISGNDHGFRIALLWYSGHICHITAKVEADELPTNVQADEVPTAKVEADELPTSMADNPIVPESTTTAEPSSST